MLLLAMYQLLYSADCVVYDPLISTYIYIYIWWSAVKGCPCPCGGQIHFGDAAGTHMEKWRQIDVTILEPCLGQKLDHPDSNFDFCPAHYFGF